MLRIAGGRGGWTQDLRHSWWKKLCYHMTKWIEELKWIKYSLPPRIVLSFLKFLTFYFVGFTMHSTQQFCQEVTRKWFTSLITQNRSFCQKKICWLKQFKQITASIIPNCFSLITAFATVWSNKWKNFAKAGIFSPFKTLDNAHMKCIVSYYHLFFSNTVGMRRNAYSSQYNDCCIVMYF